MNYKLLKVIALPAVFAFLALPVFAVDVTYNTVGNFTCGGGSNCTVNGGGTGITASNGMTISYGNFNSTVTVPPSGPTVASFGTFTSAGTALTLSDTITASFELTVTQTVPSPTGFADLTDVFAGQISANSSTITLQFTGGSGTTPLPSLGSDPFTHAPAFTFSIGGVKYWVDQYTTIPPPSSNGGVATIQGAIDASAVPEPTLYAATGLGLAGLLGVALRRRRQTQS